MRKLEWVVGSTVVIALLLAGCSSYKKHDRSGTKATTEGTSVTKDTGKAKPDSEAKPAPALATTPASAPEKK